VRRTKEIRETPTPAHNQPNTHTTQKIKFQSENGVKKKQTDISFQREKNFMQEM